MWLAEVFSRHTLLLSSPTTQVFAGSGWGHGQPGGGASLLVCRLDFSLGRLELAQGL